MTAEPSAAWHDKINEHQRFNNTLIPYYVKTCTLKPIMRLRCNINNGLDVDPNIDNTPDVDTISTNIRINSTIVKMSVFPNGLRIFR